MVRSQENFSHLYLTKYLLKMLTQYIHDGLLPLCFTDKTHSSFALIFHAISFGDIQLRLLTFSKIYYNTIPIVHIIIYVQYQSKNHSNVIFM